MLPCIAMPQITLPKKLKQSRTACTVTFTDDEAAAAEQKALQKLGENIRIEGFRPGKAPADLLRQKINPTQLNEEAVHSLLPGVFSAILKEHSLHPIIPPKVDLTSRAPLTLVLTFVEKPDVKVKGAEKIRIQKKEIAVEKVDIVRMTEYLRNQYRTRTPADRPAKDGDELTVDFVGHLDGKEAAGTRATGYTIKPGSKSLIPADWTDFKPAFCAPQAPVLVGSRDDLLRLRGLVDALLRRSAELPVISGAVQESHAATDSELQRHPDSGDAPVGAVRRRAKANRHRDSGAPSCPIDSRSAPGADQ